ncbi:hypothetical protein BGU93_19295, partial [Clostridioides difficile]
MKSREQDGKGNMSATQIRPSGKGMTKQWVIDESLDMLDKGIGGSDGLIPPLSVSDKTHTQETANQLFTMGEHLDNVGMSPPTHSLLCAS